MKDTDKVIHLNERQNRIMEIMRQQNAVSVATLSSLMKVSEVTIRKDLTMLEEQHMLYRVHGSAILVNRYINDRSVAEKEKLYADEKHAIGVYAARLIGPDDTIMVASGTTTLAMAREIGQNDRLTVITSAFSVASELSTRRSVDVIQLGGMVRRSSLSVLGPFAEQMLGSLSCSKLFMGVDGVDLDYGVTTTNHIEASLHKQMIASVQKVIVLADSSKFGRRGFSKICDMSAVDQIITDDKAPASVIERLQESGGRWKGVLWKDGQPTYFTEEVGTEVTGLYVKEGKYIIEGNMTADSGDIVTCIWTEEGVQVISEGMALCQGTGLAVAGSDIYVAGNAYDMDYGTYEEIYRSPVWKNGTEMALEVVSSDNFTVWGLACAFVDTQE